MVHRAFPDHHAYTQADIDGLHHTAAAMGADSLVTTAKDAVKLNGLKFELPCYVAIGEVEIGDEGSFKSILCPDHAYRSGGSSLPPQ
jgi:tetraacyldisaccharide-1-P 4'-kinase